MLTLCSPEIEVVEEGRDYSGAERLLLPGVNTDTVTTGVLGRVPPARYNSQAYLSPPTGIPTVGKISPQRTDDT